MSYSFLSSEDVSALNTHTHTHTHTHSHAHAALPLCVGVRFCDHGYKMTCGTDHERLLVVSLLKQSEASPDEFLRCKQLTGLPNSWINAQRVHTADSNWCPLSTQMTYIRQCCIAKAPFAHLSAKAKRWKLHTQHSHIKGSIHFSLVYVFLSCFSPHRRSLWF